MFLTSECPAHCDNDCEYDSDKAKIMCKDCEANYGVNDVEGTCDGM